MFSRIAPRYDLLNHLLSLYLDKFWRRRTARRFRHILARHNARVLDLCCGTGDLAIALKREAGRESRRRGTGEGATVWGSDFAHPMLRLAIEKTRGAQRGVSLNGSLKGGDSTPDRHNQIRFIEADALALPFPDSSFDLISAAFGFRNLANYEAGLREILRVLKPGGEVGILEFGSPHIPVLASFFRFYFKHILPRVGGAVSGSSTAYSYLPASVSKFPSAKELAVLMTRAGFRDVRFDRWAGGIVALHSARRI